MDLSNKFINFAYLNQLKINQMKRLIILTDCWLPLLYICTDRSCNWCDARQRLRSDLCTSENPIEIEVKANKITYTPGEFSKYADRYLRLNKVSADPEEYWELTSVQVKPVGIPDKDNVYFVKMKDKTVAPLIELTEDGIIKSINVPIDKKAAIPAQSLVPAQKKKVNPRDFLTEEILMANSTAKMAELVAKEIYNIRESKNALVRGQADNMPKDGAQLKLMLDHLDEQEQAMTEMFSGVLNKEEKIYTIRLTPQRT